MDDRQHPTAERRAGGDPAWRSGDRMSLYAARLASPEVTRARETRQRAEAYASRGMVPFGRRPAKRAARPRRTLIASVAALASLAGGGGAALAGQAVYQIKSGDTLSELAEAHGSSVEELAGLNGIPDPDLIVTGETLLLPESSAVTATSSAVYVVEWGDTLSEIAEQRGTTVELLMEFNSISDPDLIVVGVELLIPTVIADVPEPTEVVVEDSGDGEGEPVDPGNMSDHDDDGDGSTEAPPADDGSTSDDTSTDVGSTDAPAEDTGDSGEATDDDSTAAEDADDGSAETPADDTGDADTDSDTADPIQEPIEIEVAALHLVTEGETLESIAELYGISVDDLVSVNGQAAEGVTPGMILAIPQGATAGVQLVGVPDVEAGSAAEADAAALAAATGYWGGEIPSEETAAALAAGGYNVDVISGMLERYGYHAGIFDSSDGIETLAAQIDAGIPVIVWIDDGSGMRAVVVQGYDESGIVVQDVLNGQNLSLDLDAFVSAWDAGGGTAIAVAPL